MILGKLAQATGVDVANLSRDGFDEGLATDEFVRANQTG